MLPNVQPPTAFIPANAALYDAIRRVYDDEVGNLVANETDFGSEDFLAASYDYVRFQPEGDVRVQAIVDAAFAAAFRTRTEEAVRIFFDDRQGGTVETNLLVAIDDFLNWVLPRSIGLPDANNRFNQMYARFERNLLSEVFELDITALVAGVADHGANFRRAGNTGFMWASRPLGAAADNGSVRDSAVTYFDLRQQGYPIGGGRSLQNVGNFFLLDVRETFPKRDGVTAFASSRTEEVTRRVVFLLRLLTRSSVFSDYQGFRTLGHMSGHYMVFMNWPDEFIPDTQSSDLMLYDLWFRILLPYAMTCPWNELEVVHRKFEDAFRRQRTAVVNRGRAERQMLIDRLLDHCQALEALLPLRSKYQIAMSASALLAGHLNDDGQRASQIFNTVSDQYSLRNDVMHGRVDDVLAGRGRHLDVPSLEEIVRDLTTLRILNPGLDFPNTANQILLRRPVEVTRMAGLLEAERQRLQRHGR
jgi:hypothetical protein